jgi:hypothetical protein
MSCGFAFAPGTVLIPLSWVRIDFIPIVDSGARTGCCSYMSILGKVSWAKCAKDFPIRGWNLRIKMRKSVLYDKRYDKCQTNIERGVQVLKQKENNMREIVGNAYTQLGKELKEAQEALANNRTGIFEEWYTALGFKKQTVYNMINRYNLIVQQLDNKELIEELPLRLTYEIAKKNAPAELKQKVLDGEVKTLKDYKEFSSLPATHEQSFHLQFFAHRWKV